MKNELLVLANGIRGIEPHGGPLRNVTNKWLSDRLPRKTLMWMFLGKTQILHSRATKDFQKEMANSPPEFSLISYLI